MTRELRQRGDRLASRVLEHDDGRLPVYVAVEVHAHQVAVLLAHEIRRAIRAAAFAVVTDASSDPSAHHTDDRLGIAGRRLA